MAPFEDLYALLGVSFGTPSAEINKAFRRVSLKCHPDKLPAAEKAAGEIRFKQLSAARDTLTDPQARKTYDSRWQTE